MVAPLRVLVFYYSDSISDVFRAAGVATALSRRGVGVTLAGGDGRYRFIADAVGVRNHVLTELPLAASRRAARRGTVLSQRLLRQMIDEDLDLVDAVRPNAVVTSFRLSAYAALRLRKTLHVSIGFVYWLREFFEWVLPRWPADSWRRMGCATPPVRIDDLGFSFTTMGRELRTRGVPAISSWDQLLRTDLNVVCEVPDLFQLPRRKRYPSDVAFVGPVSWAGGDSDPDVVEFLSGAAASRLVALTFGGTGPARSARALHAALSRSGHSVLAYGPQFKGRHVRPHTLAVPGANGMDVARCARVVVCHGGSGTVNQYLAHGVPVIVLPDDFEQRWNGYAVQEFGAGAVVRTVPEAVNRVGELLLDQATRRRARQASRLIRARGSAFDEAARMICGL